jgi:hypothetical protein
MSAPSLSWRVPTTGDPRLLRLALAQVGLATMVAALVLAVAAPRQWLGPSLLGLIPLAVFMAYRRWHAYRQSLEGSDNMRIDEMGFHWLNAGGQAQSFPRQAITGFHIGRDSDTLRPVPALTLHLTGGFESQPIELHPPATPERIRDVLAGLWNIAERDASKAPAGDYDVAAFIYSECHEEFQQWHWEGTKEELSQFFALFAAAADELPLPPPGAKPVERIVLASRRQPTRLRLSHAAAAHFDADTLAAPAAVLHAIAAQAATALAGAAETSDVKFDVPLALNDVWTFYLHIRPA